ncbi:hypothetical protein K458DRAFT_322111, partial [Lentithecium fluviatile CBS 122367]
YIKAIKGLIYLILSIYSNIAFTILYLSRLIVNLLLAYKTTLKQVFYYLKGTYSLVLTYYGLLTPLARYTNTN